MPSQNRFAFFKGKIVAIEDAKIGIMTSAFNYGTAVFEGIRAYWSDKEKQLLVFRLREHYERFIQNARFLRMELPYTCDQLCDTTTELLRREGYKTDTYIRPVAYKSGEAVGVRLHDLPCDCSMFAIPFGEYIDRPAGARLTVSAWKRLDDNALPARKKIVGAYVNSALAKTDAALSGFDDALMLSGDGHVSEASAANMFIVRNGVLITPPVTADILEGITRATVIELARDLGMETQERLIDRSELHVAEEMLLCGTGVGVMPVIEVDHHAIGAGKIGPIARKLRTLYLAVARGQEARYRSWCTEVYAPEGAQTGR
ncbi:MAG: branched-chain amino acid transaminase [Candidatus Eisenbacteria bacterium]|nr:branched-chain amino acid transaminase [Candidatus Eisenbacteria bacterium]